MKIVVLGDTHQAGLEHISWVISMYVGMAGALNATLLIPKPCLLLHKKHNAGVNVDCDHGWSLYLRLPECIKEIPPPVAHKVTQRAAALSDDYAEMKRRSDFVWKISVYTLLPAVRHFFQTFPFPRPICASSRLSIVRTLIAQRPFLGVRIRRGDDKCEKYPCKQLSTAHLPKCPTSAAHISCWWQKNNVSERERIMLATDERDPRYVAELQSYRNITWIDPLLRKSARNNYEVYVGVKQVMGASTRVLLRHRAACDRVCNGEACDSCSSNER